MMLLAFRPGGSPRLLLRINRILGTFFVTTLIAASSASAQAPGADADADLVEESQETRAATVDDERANRTLQERIRAVSRRVFLKRQRFELTPQFGFTTNDAINRSYQFGARGSFHFNEELAIDFGGGGGFNQPLQDIRLQDGGSELPDTVQAVEQIAHADVGVTFSPFYGKLAVMAEHVIHFDGFLSGGLGVIVDNSPEVVHPAVELGVGGRVFLTRWLTLRADLRNYVYPLTIDNKLTFPSSLILTFGLGVFLPFDFDYSSEIIGAKG